MAVYKFESKIEQLLKIVINSLYINKETFLRELISNASDALDKINFLSISDDKYKKLKFDSKIVLVADKNKKTLTISDSGIGMNKKDMIENLGTIANSGTKAFIETVIKNNKKDSNLIGQFGVGFYSSFMVASKVEVLSKKANEDQVYLWVSESGSTYEIKDASKEKQGTDITLHLKEDYLNFLEEDSIKEIIKKYSNHIGFNIFLKTDGKCTQINKGSALWRLNKQDIKDEEYKDFFKQAFHDSNNPLYWIHTKVEGSLEYTTLFYIPSKLPFGIFNVGYKPDLKLYVKRVFINDDYQELLPPYLRFISGIVDADDLPLNISREMLQNNALLNSVKTSSTKKILKTLNSIKDSDKELYIKIFNLFGKILKEGLFNDFLNRDAILDLLMLKSSKSDELTSFDEYKKNMKSNQKNIYYIIGQDEKALRKSPLIEKFTEKGLEVIIFHDEIDAVVMPNIGEYKSLKLKSVSSSDIDDERLSVNEKDKDNLKYKELTIKMKEILKDQVKDVRISQRLSKSPACIVYDNTDMDYNMQEVLKKMGQNEIKPSKPVLEINPTHTIFSKILLKNDFTSLYDISFILLNEAMLIEGIKIEDALDFSNKINNLISKGI